MMAHMMTPLFPQGDNGGHMPFRAGERAIVMAVEGQREGGRGRGLGVVSKRLEMQG